MISRKDLVAGQNFILDHQDLHILIVPEQTPSGLELDSSVFLLNDQDKVNADNDFVFFNQPSRVDQGIELDCEQHRLTLHLNRVAPATKRIVFASTIFQGNIKGVSFKEFKKMTILVKDFLTGIEIAAFPVDTTSFSETALIFAELYRHQGNWKFRAVGSGFIGGLEPLAKHFGVDISEGEQEKQLQSTTQTSAKPSKPVNLNKITLEKKGQSITLQKKPQGQLGKIHINLNWNSQPVKSSGFFFKRVGNKGIDLDLGCLFELKDGSIGGIQALGNRFGNLNQPPYIELDADDRSGTSINGENLFINGDHWHLFHRILVFTFIYSGIPNWSHVDAKIILKNNEQADIEVRLDSHRDDQKVCAIAMLENVDNRVVITKLLEYFDRHQAMDKAYGWGLSYKPGSK